MRGRERSRTPEDVLAEVQCLADQGYVEIMLLGQNVNSYGVNFLGESEIINNNPEYGFPELLEDVCQIDDIKRVRFMTSHPKDLSDKLLDVIVRNPKIARHIHLPVQSGSSRVLKEMNRRYSKDDYIALVDRIRAKLPDVSLTTDINDISEWQGGDIVVFKKHIGIVSDKRNKDGIPFVIHHANPLQLNYEEDILKGRTDIVGHYRIS